MSGTIEVQVGWSFMLGAALATLVACGGNDEQSNADEAGTGGTSSNAGDSGGSSSGGSTSSSSGGSASGGDTSTSSGGSSGGGGAGGGSSSTTAPSLCGDLSCSASETCDSCQVDCGECEEPPVTECNDGIDNDGDGLVDWQFDMGCWSNSDTTETSQDRVEEAGFTTFDLSDDSTVVYVSSSEGDDANDGLTPETAVATPARGAELVRDGYPDFLLFRRGDSWRAQEFGDRVQRRFKSGRDAEHPMVVSSYGDSDERPRFEVDKAFIDDDGNERNYLAVVGLAFVSYPKVPDDPEFNGADGGGLRFVGTGHDILIEDNYVEYGEFIVQNVTDVEVRNNVVYRSYHVDTCAYDNNGDRDPNGDSTHRPSGIFAGAVDGLLIEGNVFDENGWNPELPEACATIYNHDLYLSGCSRLTVRKNLIMRASSIGIKMSSSEPGAASEIRLEDNLFAEGEIGISMGGNADTEHRFTQAVVANNVFTDIGRAQPTTRDLTWYIELTDNDETLVENNLLVNQPELGNSYGIRLGGGTNRDVTVAGNLFYGLQRRNLIIAAEAGWGSIDIEDNRFLSDSSDPCLISHDGGFADVDYSGNAYRSAASADAWFCVDGDRMDLTDWTAASGEASATTSDFMAPDPGRNLDRYAAQLGLGNSLADFAASARRLSRHRYRAELTAVNAANYIREGFGVAPR